MTVTHRRIVVSERGAPDVLQPVEQPLPEPGSGEVGVRMLAAGVSAMDPMVRSMSFPGFTKVPFTPGTDMVGVVEAVGPEVTGIETGMVVAVGPMWSGGYTEYGSFEASLLTPVPDGVDPVEAVCLIANYVTAYAVMHRTAGVEEGQRVLIHGAAGGVGTAFMELGALMDLEMYGTASQANLDFVDSKGATPIDYVNEDFVARIGELTGDGVDAVFDPIGGGRQLRRSYRCLRKGGSMCWFGVADTKRRGRWVIPSSLLMRLLLALIPDGKRAPMHGVAGAAEGGLPELLDMLAEGKLSPTVAGTFPLSEAYQTHEAIETGGHRGRFVLIPG